MGLINPMNEKSGALPDNENDIQSEKRQSAISAEFQWFSGRNCASVNRTAMVIAGSGESAGREVCISDETGLIYRKKHFRRKCFDKNTINYDFGNIFALIIYRCAVPNRSALFI